MSEQTVHPHEPQDFTEVLFNGVRDVTYQLDPEFTDTHHETHWPPVVIASKHSNIEHFYEVTAYDTTTEGRKFGLRGGLSFELSHLAITHLGADEAVDHITERIPRGLEWLSYLPTELLLRLRSADEALLFDYRRYTVGTFTPEVQSHHVFQVQAVHYGEEFPVINYETPPEPSSRGLAKWIPRPRRPQEDLKVQESQTEVLHILGQWSVAQMPNARYI
jgi:hypothetical protein